MSTITTDADPLPAPWPPPAGAPVRTRMPVAKRRWLRRGALLAVLGTALALDASPLFTVIALFVIVAPFEKLFWRHRQPVRRPELGTDITYALLSGPASVLGVVVGVVVSFVSLLWLPALALRPLVSALPALPRTLLGLALFDLAIYWAHRFGHEVPFLWRFHRLHHSTRHLDWVSGFRNHPLDGALFAPAFVFLLVAGFSPQFGGALLVIQLVTGLFLHANVRWRWRPLHRIVITPEFHHWHHTNEVDAHNTNYSVFLPLWDILFGTYYMPADRRPAVYGVDGPVPATIAGQVWEPLRGLPRAVRSLRHPVRAAGGARRALRRGATQLRASATRRPAHR